MKTTVLTNEMFADLREGMYSFGSKPFKVTKVESVPGRSKSYTWMDESGNVFTGNIGKLKEFAGCNYTRHYTRGGDVKNTKKVYDMETITSRAENLRGKFSEIAASYGSLFEKYGYALDEDEKAAFDTLAAAAEKAVTAWKEKAVADMEQRKAEKAAAEAKKQAADAIDALKADPDKMAKLLELLNSGAL